MIRTTTAHAVVMAMPDVSVRDHAGGDAFYARERRFATLWHETQEMNLFLTPEQQKAFVDKDPRAIFEIPNGFGRMGWTTVRLAHVSRKLLTEALGLAWENAVAKAAAKRRKPQAKPKSPARAKR